MKSVRVGMDTLGIVLVSVFGGGVNQADEWLGQPKQVMTAGTHGPSGQLIFDGRYIESCVHAKQ